ncbi:hypothetical protein [Nonomuraea mesophila]|uniref:hypothetical protein n=1 Tax=Nonomuraea mesophila TaxID=2530382 RepID=UPI0015F2CACD|nr:hypothetical protein [Nonomuraea mesophila]
MRTPDSRERNVDMWRALAICLVVLGHWFVVAVTYRSGRMSGYNALDVLGWLDPVTWLFQVLVRAWLGPLVKALVDEPARERLAPLNFMNRAPASARDEWWHAFARCAAADLGNQAFGCFSPPLLRRPVP